MGGFISLPFFSFLARKAQATNAKVDDLNKARRTDCTVRRNHKILAIVCVRFCEVGIFIINECYANQISGSVAMSFEAAGGNSPFAPEDYRNYLYKVTTKRNRHITSWICATLFLYNK